MGDKVRFSTFAGQQKRSIRNLKIVRLLERCDKTRYPIYVKNQKALSIKLRDMVFTRELDIVLRR